MLPGADRQVVCPSYRACRRGEVLLTACGAVVTMALGTGLQELRQGDTTMRGVRRWGSSVLLLGLVWTGCTSTPPMNTAVPLDKSVPDIEGKEMGGKPLKLSDFRGKVVLLDFSATW